MSEPARVGRLVEGITIVSPKIAVVMGREALIIVNDLGLPLGREVCEGPGVLQSLTPSIEARYVLEIDESLEEESARSAPSRRPPGSSGSGGPTCRRIERPVVLREQRSSRRDD